MPKKEVNNEDLEEDDIGEDNSAATGEFCTEIVDKSLEKSFSSYKKYCG